MSSEGSTLPSGSLSQGLALGLGPRLGVLPGEVGVTSAFPPHVQLLILFMASEDDDQFLPGLVLHHPHHAVQTGAAGEAPLLGERLGVGGVKETESSNPLITGWFPILSRFPKVTSLTNSGVVESRLL